MSQERYPTTIHLLQLALDERDAEIVILKEQISGLNAFMLAQMADFQKVQLEMREKMDGMEMEIVSLKSKNEELEVRLKQNSQNSSRPSSSDGLQKKPALPKKKSPNKGGQPGHKGNTLLQTSEPDEIVRLTTPKCICGRQLNSKDGTVMEVRQVFDLPQPKLHVTEYQQIRQRCTCGKIHLGQMPPGVVSPTQYGSGVRAFVTMLTTSCQVSLQNTCRTFEELFGYSINEGTVLNFQKKAYDQLAESENVIREALLESKAVHVDETGIRIKGELGWIHTASTSKFTLLFAHRKRGTEAHDVPQSILDQYQGYLIHDCLGAYFTYENLHHGLCCAHLLRELYAQIEQKKPWAEPLHTFLLDLYRLTEKGTKVIGDMTEKRVQWIDLCKKAIATEEIQWKITHPPGQKNKKGRPARGKSLALLDRLLKYTQEILAFAYLDFVPFTNNQAERDVRPAKGKMKIAGCFRTIFGAQAYTRIQSFLSTCRKHKLNVFIELRNAFSAKQNYIPAWGG